MKIYKNLNEFNADGHELRLADIVSSEIKKQLRAFDTEFASDEENCVVVLNNNEKLGDLYQDFPHLESIRPENSASYGNYINQVYITGDERSGVSVFLSVDPPAPWRQCY